jgi:hypothetical protein
MCKGIVALGYAVLKDLATFEPVPPSCDSPPADNADTSNIDTAEDANTMTP